MGSIAILSDIAEAVFGPIEGIIEAVAVIIGDAITLGSAE